MRVLVELLDRDPLKNVLASCVFAPEIVVYLCDTRDGDFFKESAIYRLFRRRKLKTKPRFYYFDATDPVGVRRVLNAVVRDYPGCVFDLSGGRDLVLVMAGACFAELKLPAFYIDAARGRFVDLQGCGHLAQRFEVPRFAAEDILAMAGATVHGYGHFADDAIDAELERDILCAYGIVMKNPKAWGEFVAWLQALCSGTPATQLTVSGPRRSNAGRGSARANPVLLEHLRAAGLLARVVLGKNHAELTFKSPLMRKCLLIEGIWLELFCYVTAKNSGAFNDVRTSVVVDWDGVEGGEVTAKNEVDVLLVQKLTPVFISCKMSLPSALALSEIKLLAAKFGGGLGKAVVLTAARCGTEHRALQTRAAELGITLLDAESATPQTLQAALLAVVAPPPAPKARLADAAMLPGPN